MAKKQKSEIELLSEMNEKLDKIFAVIAVHNIENKNDKIYALKKSGLSFDEINTFVGVKNVRQMEGWKRK